jgi:hypothetical protein
MFAISSIEKEAIVDILYIVPNFSAAFADALSPSGVYKLCIAVGDRNNGISIFFPKTVVDKSGSPTLFKILGTKSQSLNESVFLFNVTSSSAPPSM